MNTVLVTGATGFLGRNFVDFLLSQGWNVVCLVRPASRFEHLKKEGIRLVFGDFTQKEILQEAVTGVDYVFHLAGATVAPSFERMLEVNRQYTENLVKVCIEQQKPPVFVYVSSLAAVGPSTAKQPHVEEDPCKPVSWYGKSKLAAETMLRSYADRLPISVLRPPMLFGPFDREVSKWFKAIKKTGIFFIPFLRSFRYSMAHSEDVSDVLLRIALKGERLPNSPNGTEFSQGQGIYFISQTESPTYSEMGRLFGNALDRRFTFVLPMTPVFVWIFFNCCELWGRMKGRIPMLNRDKFRELMAGSWSCSAEKARKQLNFQNLHSLQEQCRKTAESLKLIQEK